MSKEYGTGRLHTKSVIDWKKAVSRQLDRQTAAQERQQLEQEKTNNQTPHDEPSKTR